MPNLKRFSVAVPEKLLEKFDSYIQKEGYPNRSKVIVDLINKTLIRDSWHKKEEVAGTIVLVFDHHKHNLSRKLTEIQHDFYEIIISSQHIHFSHDSCMEIIIVKGQADKILTLASKIRREKGIFHFEIVMTGTGDILHQTNH